MIEAAQMRHYHDKCLVGEGLQMRSIAKESAVG